MSTNISSNTNTTALIGAGNVMVANTTNNGTVSINTATGAPMTMSKTTNDDLVTLLTFGPLSSCITLPNLAAKPLPAPTNFSSVTQRQQVIQTWIDGLPTTSSCTTFAWTLVPDYSEHLNSMATFQGQLQQLFPAINSTLGTSKPLEIVPVGPNGVSNGTSPTNSSSSSVTSTSNGSFFGGDPGSGSLLGSSSPSNTTLPSGLSLWIGAVLVSTALVHLLALILHICSDLDSLFPSLVSKLQERPAEPVLPSHALSINHSSATLVDAKTLGDSDAKVADPPEYAEPISASAIPIDDSPKQTPALLRYSRKAKKIMVPLMLLSALATIAVAVVLNSKFSAGPVTQFPTSLSSAVSPPPPAATSLSSSSVPLPTAVSSSAEPTTSNSNASSSRTNRSAPAATSSASVSAARPAEDSRQQAAPVDPPAVSTTATMTRLVRRQTSFLPSLPTSSPVESPPTAPRPSAPVSASASSPSPSSTAIANSSAVATPNASLFPSLPSPTSSSPTSATSSLSASSPSSANANSDFTTASLNPSDNTSNSSSLATDAGSLFVVERGDSMHRLWWIVMLDLLLWFCQRRRTRSQTAFDKARSTLLSQFRPPIGAYKQQQQQQQQGVVEHIEMK